MTAVANAPSPLEVLVVDDEPLARSRMATLLGDCTQPPAVCRLQAANAVQAMEALHHQRFDVLLLDIHMPGTDGLSLACNIANLPNPPALIFVTAHAEHAVQAFELEAVDYLTKPVRLERLQAALQKAQHFLQTRSAGPLEESAQDVLVIQDRNRTERVPLLEVVYFKAELKYITVRTREREFLIEESLTSLEEEFKDRFVRIHRNALVARPSIAGFERVTPTGEGEAGDPYWQVVLREVPEKLPVSRRQWSIVKGLVS
jgi:two-component system response regulator AlgR